MAQRREVIVMVESDKIGRKIPNLEIPCTDHHFDHRQQLAESLIQGSKRGY